MQRGGNHRTDAYPGLGQSQDQNNRNFAGARFDFLAANVTEAATGKTLFLAYRVKNCQCHKVAFAGITLEGTPALALAPALAPAPAPAPPPPNTRR